MKLVFFISLGFCKLLRRLAEVECRLLSHLKFDPGVEQLNSEL